MLYHKTKPKIDESWIISNFPVGSTKRKVIEDLNNHKILYDEDNKQNTIIAMFRYVSGSLVKQSIQVAFFFDNNDNLSRHAFHDYFTGP